jgi:hypothetical protein
MKPKTEEKEKDEKHWQKGTTKTIGNIKRVVKKMYGTKDTEAKDKPQKK